MNPEPENRSRSSRLRRQVRWIVPFAVTGVIVGGVAIAGAASSSASPTLPARTAQQLLAEVGGSTARSYSGQFTEATNLGLPSLPGTGSDASLSWQSFLTGAHTARVWVDGPDKQRLALLGELSEADVIHNGANLWTYTSDSNSVSHVVLTDHRTAPPRSGRVEPSTPDITGPGADTPTSVAAQILNAITPTTRVTVDPTRRVAGRAAYTLDVRPRDARSTIRVVTIAIDAHTSLPLQVQIFGAGSQPALSIGFSSISFATPAASTFNFVMPKGASVATDPFGLSSDPLTHSHHRHHDASSAEPTARQSAPSTSAPQSTSTIGSGWTSVLEVRGGSTAGLLRSGTLSELTSTIGGGIRLLHTALINAVILTDGRTFIGAVSPALLEHIAATTTN